MQTSSNFDDVVQFHKQFKIDYSGPPRSLPEELKWRVKFLKEELQEYEDALRDYEFYNLALNPVEAEKALMKQFDALLDLVYVGLGTAHLQGFPWQAGWFWVQYANMAKKLSEPGEGRGTNDIVKPEGWQPPDRALIEVLRRQAAVWDKEPAVRG